MNGAPLALGSLAALIVGSAVGSDILGAPLHPDAGAPAGSRAISPQMGLGLLLVGGAAAGALLLWPRRARAEVLPRTSPLDTSLDISLTPPAPVPAAAPAAAPAPAAPAAAPAPAPAASNAASNDDAFYRAILVGVGAPITDNGLLFLRAWRQAEGGTAAYNPVNTTWKKPGTTDYNSRGVKNYPDPVTGLSATVKTLLSSYYTGIVDALRRGAPASKAAAALRASPWGTGAGAERVLAGRVAPPPIGTIRGAPAIASVDPAARTLV